MDRIGYFEWNGDQLPTVASARVLQSYMMRYTVSLMNMGDSFEHLDIENTLFLLAEMLKAGAKWEEANGGEPLPVPSFDTLMDEISLSDLPRATVCVMDTLAKGLQANVKAKPKNV